MTTHDGLKIKVDQLFAEWDKSDSPGTALAVTRDGKVIYTQGYGAANLEYDIPITPDNRLRYRLSIQAICGVCHHHFRARWETFVG